MKWWPPHLEIHLLYTMLWNPIVQSTTNSDYVDKSISSYKMGKAGQICLAPDKKWNLYRRVCTVLKGSASCDVDSLSVKKQNMLALHREFVSWYETKYPGGVLSRVADSSKKDGLLLLLKPQARVQNSDAQIHINIVLVENKIQLNFWELSIGKIIKKKIGILHCAYVITELTNFRVKQ